MNPRSPLRHLRDDAAHHFVEKVLDLSERSKLPLTCACQWEIPVVYATLDDTKPSREVILACPCCGVPIRAKVEIPK